MTATDIFDKQSNSGIGLFLYYGSSHLTLPLFLTSWVYFVSSSTLKFNDQDNVTAWAWSVTSLQKNFISTQYTQSSVKDETSMPSPWLSTNKAIHDALLFFSEWLFL